MSSLFGALVLLATVGSASVAHAETWVPGYLTGPVVWTVEDGPYILDRDVHIDGDLEIQAGVEVRVQAHDVSEIGTPLVEIRVLSGNIDVLGERGAQVEIWGIEWQGIRLEAGVRASFAHTRIEGADTAITSLADSLRLSHVVADVSGAGLRQSGGELVADGLWISGGELRTVNGTVARLWNVLVEGVLGHAMVLGGDTTLTHATLRNSGGGMVVLNGTYTVDVRNSIIAHSTGLGVGTVTSSPTVRLVSTDVFDHALGNFGASVAPGVAPMSLDPRFAATTGPVLLEDSPCIDAADPTLSTSFDVAGNPRPVPGPLGTEPLPDIGAYELGRCGDGYVQIDAESCDDGNDVDDDACRVDCTLPVCGDGAVASVEECDDGNLISGDGCSDECTLELEPDAGVVGPDGGGGPPDAAAPSDAPVAPPDGPAWLEGNPALCACEAVGAERGPLPSSAGAVLALALGIFIRRRRRSQRLDVTMRNRR